MTPRPSLFRTLSGGLFLIGIGLISLLKMPFAPTILASIGLSSIPAGLAAGRAWNAIQSGRWLVALLLFLYFNILWPGILILLGVSALVGALTRPMLRAWSLPSARMLL